MSEWHRHQQKLAGHERTLNPKQLAKIASALRQIATGLVEIANALHAGGDNGGREPVAQWSEKKAPFPGFPPCG
jgi:hypothetical protein